MRLLEMEQENLNLKTQLSEAETSGSARDSELTKLRRRLQTLERQNESLQNANTAYEQERRGLEREVERSALIEWTCAYECEWTRTGL